MAGVVYVIGEVSQILQGGMVFNEDARKKAKGFISSGLLPVEHSIG